MLQSAYETREFVLTRLHEDLLGGDVDSVLDEDPLARFVVGVLYPERASDDPRDPESVESDEIDTTQDGDAGSSTLEGQDDPVIALAQVRHPRTMGMTFSADLNLDSSLTVCIESARYLADGTGDSVLWHRETPVFEPIILDLSKIGRSTHFVAQGLELHSVVREPLQGDSTASITLALVNTEVATWEDRPTKCWFDPVIRVEGKAGVITSRPDTTIAGLDDDEVMSQLLLFKEIHSFGIGHGCAVTWERDTSAPTWLSTTFLPTHELLLSNPGGKQGLDLSMTTLAAATDFSDLHGLVDDYRDWIRDLVSHGDPLSDEELSVLQRHQREASEAADRMSAGIHLLNADADVAQAFQLMNEAMAEQRSRQDFHRSGGIGDPPSRAAASWRPFQIAFILLNLEGLCRPDSPDRKTADLLWFPTGGGKTEAYLGLIAISILLRRIHNSSDAGVSVIMRYTLRLLTLQQFQRAAGLICALESLRVRSIPASAPISIGLWVGQSSTPNRVSEAKQALNAARSHRVSPGDADSADPVQLRQCPWCGTTLDHRDYSIVDNERMIVSCGYSGCAFRNGLPVHIVDEDVYRERPSLLIATVDKFAMMPWKPEVGALFGTDISPGASAATPSPDLVIQDELHLISGPLGTVVGLYETAVDAACSRIAPPKIVASTATIRRAGAQVGAVFARAARQFPPPGRSQKDSYFALEASRDEKGSREYVGVMGAGTSHTTLMVRVYASLLQSAAAVPEGSENADLYWTLLGYFNSLRVLGGAYIQVLDDVPGHMEVIARRRGEPVRYLDQPREMTSRKTSSEIPAELAALERRRGEPESPHVVLATNMISVGVDVDRLSLMAVMGQPQTSSEYIQATSRVGRRWPGMVVTIYNAARTRDLSHFENFTGYHQTLYRHVEATGATPWAPRARDRALHGVLVAMARLLIPGAGSEKAAGNAAEWASELDEIVERIVERAESSADGGSRHPVDESPEVIRDELMELVQQWTEADLTHYAGWFGRDEGALLIDASTVATDNGESGFSIADPPWPTLTSMRDVDAESSLYLVRGRKTHGK